MEKVDGDLGPVMVKPFGSKSKRWYTDFGQSDAKVRNYDVNNYLVGTLLGSIASVKM